MKVGGEEAKPSNLAKVHLTVIGVREAGGCAAASLKQEMSTWAISDSEVHAPGPGSG